jgi:Raf kinase inhibitor-like YbhB/YbcL family protein
MNLTSPAFPSDGAIPPRFTCDGDDISPPLRWSGAPAGTRSFVLIVDDPDAPDPAAPKRVWVHWVLYNLPASLNEIPESASASALGGVRTVLNDSGEHGYGGPCPPIGRHRYFHKLFALDTVLPDLGHRAKRSDVESAMAGHIIAEASLMGTYQRRSKGPD